MSTTQSQFTEVLNRIKADSLLLHNIVQGDATTTVITEGGTVDSAAKAIAGIIALANTAITDIETRGQAAIDAVVAHDNTSLIGLTDTPAAYGNNAGKVLAVNARENAVEFVDEIAAELTGLAKADSLAANGGAFDWADVQTYSLNGSSELPFYFYFADNSHLYIHNLDLNEHILRGLFENRKIVIAMSNGKWLEVDVLSFDRVFGEGVNTNYIFNVSPSTTFTEETGGAESKPIYIYRVATNIATDAQFAAARDDRAATPAQVNNALTVQNADLQTAIQTAVANITVTTELGTADPTGANRLSRPLFRDRRLNVNSGIQSFHIKGDQRTNYYLGFAETQLSSSSITIAKSIYFAIAKTDWAACKYLDINGVGRVYADELANDNVVTVRVKDFVYVADVTVAYFQLTLNQDQLGDVNNQYNRLRVYADGNGNNDFNFYTLDLFYKRLATSVTVV